MRPKKEKKNMSTAGVQRERSKTGRQRIKLDRDNQRGKYWKTDRHREWSKTRHRKWRNLGRHTT